ncbi:MAG: biopolymer transporter ExbD [Verrucomicrobiota bacterium]
MRFYTRKKRSPQLIIVSLIDILAILLIFFIVSTTFRKEQPRLQINLPESQSAEVVAAEKSEPLILRVKSADEITLGAEPVAIGSLADALKAAKKSSPDRPIAMQADREAPFGVVVKVLDALKQAGVKNIPAFTQPEPR